MTNKKQTTTVIEGELEQKKITTPAAIDYDDEAQALVNSLLSLNDDTTLDLPIHDGRALTGAALEEGTRKKEGGVAKSKIELGFFYILLKRELGHGAFEGRLKDNGAHPNTAREAMRAAFLVASLSKPNQRRAVDLVGRKLDVLTRLPAQVVDDLFNDGTLDNIDSTSRDQLQEIVQLRKQLDNELKKNDRMSDRVAALDEEARRTRALPEQPLYIKELRRAVLEETEALRANARTLQEVMERVALLPQDTSAADIDAISHPLMYGLQGLLATAQALFDKGFDTFTSFKGDVDVFPPELDTLEVERAKRLALQFSNDTQMRARLRQVDLAPVPAPRKGKGDK